jgi:primosomal protein N' (replication factor Y)
MAGPSRSERVSVLLPLPFDTAFTYGADAPLAPGTLVRVPLGTRMVVGAVWDDPPDPAVRVRPVAEELAFPPLPAVLRRFVDWVAAYTLARRGEVLALGLKPGLLAEPKRRRTTFVFEDLDPARPGQALSADQATAAAALRAGVAAGKFAVTLLDGVTGSGKTAVYLEAVAECVASGRQALVLLPEIALSIQFLQRFAARFGAAPAVWHSELTPAVRRATFRAVAEGRAPVVVGARSALFLPFPALGLIVVDEEHESAFKQEDGVTYHARDMAVVRARLSAAACVLVSATPSLESVENAAAGRYARLDLPVRHGNAAMPAVAALDLRADPPERGRFLSPVLVGEINATLARGEQAMLFLNRRGYAPLTLCRHCGHRMACPNCTAWLVEHRSRARLICHHCGHGVVLPEECPACGAEHSFAPIGPGVERIAEEVAHAFPAARALVMASDIITGPREAAAAAAKISGREVDIIIGTQMVAKGWHFPHLTLVGVVDSDLGLAGGDLRAAERTVQMLHQVAGRAGRADAPGRVLLQTFAPEHPVIAALLSGDLPAFYAREAAQRRPGHWPPFGRLAALIVSALDERIADAAARALYRTAPRGAGIEVLGPAPAPFALLRGRHRRRLLLKTGKDIAVQAILRDWLARTELSRAARVDVDVDPVSFM